MSYKGNKASSKQISVIQPDKSIIEDWEFLAFENEEELGYYSLWHEALVDRRREIAAESERDRQIIRNERARKTRQLVRLVGDDGTTSSEPVRTPFEVLRASKSNQSRSSSTSSSARKKQRTSQSHLAIDNQQAASSRPALASGGDASRLPTKRIPGDTSRTAHHNHLVNVEARRPNGYILINSSDMNTMQASQQIVRYKLTKMYNKYRGRQERRNFVMKKQMDQRIEQELVKCQLNPWLAYTALQALRLPRECQNSGLSVTTNPHASTYLTMSSVPNGNQTASSLSATTNGTPRGYLNVPQMQVPPVITVNGKKLENDSIVAAKRSLQKAKSIPIKTYAHNVTTASPQLHQQSLQASDSSSATKTAAQTTNGSTNIQQQQQPLRQPMQLFYIDTGNTILYSNKINPQQVAEYKRKAHLMPLAATSKKSSAASYDAYEIMEVLTNTKKTNVTITRNTSKTPKQPKDANSVAGVTGGEATHPAETQTVYSHSVNPNTPGIVSTQLHLQARSYLDMLHKLYHEETERIKREEEMMSRAKQVDDENREFMSRYLYLD